MPVRDNTATTKPDVPAGRDDKPASTAKGRIGGGLLDPKILWQALPDAFRKLDPRVQVRNPVMFVVEVGALLTMYTAITNTPGPSAVFNWTIVVWLWLTVLFANLAEAVAEGRGKAQAETLRKTKRETVARRLVGWQRGQADAREEEVPGTQLTLGDHVVVEAGEIIPGDGDVVEGVASVDESAITGESAPVIRESGGDRSAVTGGTRVLSDRIVVQITSKPGETFIDRMIALVEGAKRQKTPNEIALNILLASLTIIFMLAVITLQPMAFYSGAPQSLVILVALLVALIPTTIGALTTFSIANDVAKYFAIIPAMFVSVFPGLHYLNIMALHSPKSAITSAIIFNALIIVALIPLALRGVRYKPSSASAMLRRNLWIYGVGGLIIPFIGIKVIDLIIQFIPGFGG